MRVLVTGGLGFIGSAQTDALVADGHEVVVLDALLEQAWGADAGVPAYARDWDAEAVGVLRGDVRDAGTVDVALRGVDVVIHAAAMVGLGVDTDDLPAYVGTNDLGTAVLLARAAAAGVRRVVLSSSMVVYGEGRYACDEHGVVRPGPRRSSDLAEGRYEAPCPRCGRPLRRELVGEDAPLDPRSVYAATKVAQEHLCAAWAGATGGAVTALRYHNVYGPRMPRDTPYAGVASLFRSALEAGRAPRVLEDGRQERDFVHVADVARAGLLAAQELAGRRLPGDGGPVVGTCDDGAPGLEALNVASGHPVTVGEVARALAAAVGGPEPEVVGGARAGDVRHVVADPARARERLGFHAEVAPARGLAAFATDPLRGG